MLPTLLQDSRLNYIEQHAGRLGLDNTKLEGARFSAAKASPMGDALDAASSYVDQASLGQWGLLLHLAWNSEYSFAIKPGPTGDALGAASTYVDPASMGELLCSHNVRHTLPPILAPFAMYWKPPAAVST